MSQAVVIRWMGPIVCSALLLGCSEEQWYIDNGGAGSLRIGTAKEIAAATLRETDAELILDGMLALGAVPSFRSEREAADAVEGYVAAYRKLQAGWPGFRQPARPGRGTTTVEQVRAVAYTRAAGLAQEHPRDRHRQELWRRIQALGDGPAPSATAPTG